MAPQKPIYPYAYCEDPKSRGRFPWLEWILGVTIVYAILWPSRPVDDPIYMRPLFDGLEFRVFGEHQIVERQDDDAVVIRGPILRNHLNGQSQSKILLVNRGTNSHTLAIVVCSDDFVEKDGNLLVEPESHGLIPIKPTHAGASQWSVTLKPIRPFERP